MEEGIEISKTEEGIGKGEYCSRLCSSPEVVQLLQKVIAEMMGTYFVIFIGCDLVVVNKLYECNITFLGICAVWGLIVMVMVYSIGHIFGTHFNPTFTIIFALFRQFPLKQVPIYIVAHVLGSILASGTLSLVFDTDFWGIHKPCEEY
ncbi:hypothetical protein REPUB_Repub01dG0063300 [Reevesia pubescens]